ERRQVPADAVEQHQAREGRPDGAGRRPAEIEHLEDLLEVIQDLGVDPELLAVHGVWIDVDRRTVDPLVGGRQEVQPRGEPEGVEPSSVDRGAGHYGLATSNGIRSPSTPLTTPETLCRRVELSKDSENDTS